MVFWVSEIIFFSNCVHYIAALSNIFDGLPLAEFSRTGFSDSFCPTIGNIKTILMLIIMMIMKQLQTKMPWLLREIYFAEVFRQVVFSFTFWGKKCYWEKCVRLDCSKVLKECPPRLVSSPPNMEDLNGPNFMGIGGILLFVVLWLRWLEIWGKNHVGAAMDLWTGGCWGQVEGCS